MDNVRGHFPDHEDGPDDALDYDPAEDEVVRELPPAAIGQDERRMQVRAYNFWAALLDDRNFPAIADFDPQNQPDFGPYSVLLNFTGDIDNPAVAYLGEKLAQECGSQGDIARLDDVPSRSLLSRITDHYLQIIANQAPIGFEAEFVNQRGATILYRGILLPFSSDDTAIDYIYGVINWKELADQETADELLLQIDQALESNRFAAREGLASTDWAEGPFGNVTPLQPDTPLELDPLELDTPLGDDDDEDELGFPEPALTNGPQYGSLLGKPTEASDVSISLPGNLPSAMSVAVAIDMPTGEPSLADWLAKARDHADEAASSEKRTHLALYAAIGTAHDFALAATACPADYLALLDDAGIAVQDRAPMVPVVRLVFGLGYDKTRVAEYAAVLGHACRLGLGQGELSRLLEQTPGGLKALVAEERRLRKQETGKPETSARQDKLLAKLRAMESQGIEDIPSSGAEFTLLLARRNDFGRIEILGEIGDEPALTEKAARRLVG